MSIHGTCMLVLSAPNENWFCWAWYQLTSIHQIAMNSPFVCRKYTVRRFIFHCYVWLLKCKLAWNCPRDKEPELVADPATVFQTQACCAGTNGFAALSQHWMRVPHCSGWRHFNSWVNDWTNIFKLIHSFLNSFLCCWIFSQTLTHRVVVQRRAARGTCGMSKQYCLCASRANYL